MVRPASADSLAHLEAALGVPLTRNATGIEAVSGERVRGILALDGWTPASVQAHILASPLATGRLLEAGKAYVFGQLGLRVVFASIRSDNLRALRFASHAGLEVEHRFRDVYGKGVDMVVLRLERGEVLEGRMAA